MSIETDEEADTLILGVFREQAGGRAWLGRQMLERALVKTGKMPQRKLDHRLRSLVKSGVIVRKGDHATGSVYAFSECADKNKMLANFAVATRKRGEATVAITARKVDKTKK